MPIVFPIHPRTRNNAAAMGLGERIDAIKGLITPEPLGYLDFLKLMAESALVLTDSGGIQKEAYFHKTPCITLRDETEWVETVEAGWNQITGTNEGSIQNALDKIGHGRVIKDYGTGSAGKKMAEILRQS